MSHDRSHQSPRGWRRAAAAVLKRVRRESEICYIPMGLPFERDTIRDIALHARSLPRVISPALSCREGSDRPAPDLFVPPVREESIAFQAGVQSCRLAIANPRAKLVAPQIEQPAICPMGTQIVTQKPQVRNEELLARHAKIRNSVEGHDLKVAAIRNGTEGIRRLPHMRRSADSMTSASWDPGLYLGERERKRGMLPDRCEVVAVFQKVPVEMIARLRFAEGHRLALYTLIPHAERTMTRVTDIAVLREKGRTKLHYMAHRTLFHNAELHPE